MDTKETRRHVAQVASEYLESHAEALVGQWIDWVRARVASNTMQALPERALRNHIPPVLASLAKYLAHPIELARGELLENLKLHGQIRRDQGYSLAEMLAEFDGLSNVVTEAVLDAVREEADGATADELLDLAQRLSTGLRSISFIATGTYSQSDRDRSHQIAENLSELSRAVGHEIRNPLNTIALTVDVLSEAPAEESLATHLDTISGALQRCTYLVDTMAVLTMAENARAGDQMVSMREATMRVVREFRSSAQAVGVDISGEDQMPDLMVEAISLYIVLSNLLSNAFKYRDEKKDKRIVKIDARYIPEEHDTGFVELIIEDNGVGIPEEFVSRVLQKGFRAHPHVAQGTGLGLYLVNQTVTARGGQVLIESTEGAGTRVAVRLRCLHADADLLTADQFRVEHLMGEAIWSEVAEQIKRKN
ncbi:MAG: HAMP domain-containing sensor histidine kinase [Pseudomonadota bacterium]